MITHICSLCSFCASVNIRIRKVQRLSGEHRASHRPCTQPTPASSPSTKPSAAREAKGSGKQGAPGQKEATEHRSQGCRSLPVNPPPRLGPGSLGYDRGLGGSQSLPTWPCPPDKLSLCTGRGRQRTVRDSQQRAPLPHRIRMNCRSARIKQDLRAFTLVTALAKLTHPKGSK